MIVIKVGPIHLLFLCFFEILYTSYKLSSSVKFCRTTGTGDSVDLTNSVHGFATYAYPDPDCWMDYPMAGNISNVKTFGKHLKYCTGYTNQECSDARTEKDNVPHCHTVESCSSVNTNEEFGEYWMSFDTFRATEDDDIGDHTLIENPN